ncbi:MAG: DUF1499 domain-containing protein [Planctomycetota bacterium]
MIGWIAIAITVVVFASIAFRVDDWSRDWSENFAELSFDAERDELQPLELDGPIEPHLNRLNAWVDAQARWAFASDVTMMTKVDGMVAEANLTRQTSLFRFVDDITVRLVQTGEGDESKTILYATSQSRIGKGDLGQNPRNLIELKRCFDD